MCRYTVLIPSAGSRGIGKDAQDSRPGIFSARLVQISLFDSVHPPPLLPRLAVTLNFVIPTGAEGSALSLSAQANAHERIASGVAGADRSVECFCYPKAPLPDSTNAIVGATPLGFRPRYALANLGHPSRSYRSRYDTGCERTGEADSPPARVSGYRKAGSAYPGAARLDRRRLRGFCPGAALR